MIFTNYRPVSVLTCFSKIFERIVHDRIYISSFPNIIYYTKVNMAFVLQGIQPNWLWPIMLIIYVLRFH